jgi:hypothetical protein
MKVKLPNKMNGNVEKPPITFVVSSETMSEKKADDKVEVPIRMDPTKSRKGSNKASMTLYRYGGEGSAEDYIRNFHQPFAEVKAKMPLTMAQEEDTVIRNFLLTQTSKDKYQAYFVKAK